MWTTKSQRWERSDTCRHELRTGEFGQLAQTLLERGLVDQLNFVIDPAMKGSWTTLFCPGKRTNLRVISVPERRCTWWAA